jgi:hypothetical protein
MDTFAYTIAGSGVMPEITDDLRAAIMATFR